VVVTWISTVYILLSLQVISNCIGGVIVFSVLNSIAVDRRFESWSRSSLEIICIKYVDGSTYGFYFDGVGCAVRLSENVGEPF
jgi:hypothetical protein